MNTDLAEIVCILDRSGSMQAIRDDAIGGFNAFVEDQRAAPGDGLLTLVLFDDEVEVPVDRVPLAEVPELTAETFVPRGTTALLDAIGLTIDRIAESQARLAEEERPGVTLFAILTDGQENASRRFTRDLVFQEITERQERHGWEFLFLAANQDAIAAGAALGVRPGGSVNFTADGSGTREAFRTVTSVVTGTREGLRPPRDPGDEPE